MTAVRRPGLRERKFAKTKISLVKAALGRLEEVSLDEVSVRDLCEVVEVSEATFFNYFIKKSELLDYYIQLWMLELGWHMRQADTRGLEAIATVFDRVARQFEQQPGAMVEVVAHQARRRGKAVSPGISEAERQMAFPDLAGIEDVPVMGLDRLWLHGVEQAIGAGQLPPNTHQATVLVGLAAIFYGVPMALAATNPATIASMYRQQLNIYWVGVKSMARGEGQLASSTAGVG